jgi:outer membrane protein assembly factor BamA
VAPNLYVGPQLDIMLSHAYDFENSSDTLLVGKRGLQNKDVNTFGGGLNIQYDSRDFTLNASRGHFFKIEQMFYPKLLNKYYFNCTDITYSTYVRPYKSAILAFEVNGQYNYSSQGGEVPWTYLAKSGEGNRLRGYYEGRYRDNGIIQAQIELRQHIWKRWGCALWVGGGNVFNNFQSINMERFLPSYGIGARWEMKRRVNIRFDFGFTRNKPGFCFNIGEAF